MRWTGRFFLRNKALCALFAGMVIIPSGATVYFGILKMSGFELLYNLVRIQYIIDLVWVSMTAFLCRGLRQMICVTVLMSALENASFMSVKH